VVRIFFLVWEGQRNERILWYVFCHKRTQISCKIGNSLAITHIIVWPFIPAHTLVSFLCRIMCFFSHTHAENTTYPNLLFFISADSPALASQNLSLNASVTSYGFVDIDPKFQCIAYIPPSNSNPPNPPTCPSSIGYINYPSPAPISSCQLSNRWLVNCHF
jgi:hypothetical protein